MNIEKLQLSSIDTSFVIGKKANFYVMKSILLALSLKISTVLFTIFIIKNKIFAFLIAIQPEHGYQSKHFFTKFTNITDVFFTNTIFRLSYTAINFLRSNKSLPIKQAVWVRQIRGVHISHKHSSIF